MSDAALPRVALVTPSLNQGRFICATIESVLAQDYPALDYFVQDGGSDDVTLEILRSYGSRVRWASEPDEGQAEAINRGLSRVSGEVLGYLNSDDVLRPGALRAVGEAFRSRPGTQVVFGRADYVDENGSHIAPYHVLPDAFERLTSGCPVAQPATFFSRRVWEELGPFDETLHHTMDYDYWLRIAKRFNRSEIVFLDRELAEARWHKEAKTAAAWPRALDEIFSLLQRHSGYVSLSWCLVKADFALDGLDPITNPHPMRLRAYPRAFLDFLNVNPARLWRRGIRGAWTGFQRLLAGR